MLFVTKEDVAEMVYSAAGRRDFDLSVVAGKDGKPEISAFLSVGMDELMQKIHQVTEEITATCRIK